MIEWKGGESMEKEMSKQELLDSLVDIRDVKLDPSQPVDEILCGTNQKSLSV